MEPVEVNQAESVVDVNDDNNINIQISRQNIRESAKELFDMKDLSITEVDSLFKAIKAYKNNKNYDYQNAIPKKYSYYIANVAANLGVKRKQAAKIIIQQIASDSELSSAVDTFNDELQNIMAESNAELSNLIGKNETELINEMDAMKESHPDKAYVIDMIKNALLDAKTFDKEIEWYSISPKNAALHKKVCKHENSEVMAFNKLINKSSIKCGTFEECVSSISLRSDYDISAIIKTMLILVAHNRYLKVEQNLADMSLEDLSELYYISALIFNIINIRHEMILSESSKKMLDSIEQIIPNFL